MKRNIIFLATIMGLVLCASCTKEIESNGGSTSNNGISINEVSILDAQTKAGVISSQTYKVEGDDYSFIITETTEPIVGEAETKALADKTGIMDATTLQTTGFTVDGYLGNEINSTTHPQDLHFIDKEPASYSDSDRKWHFDNTQHWKDQINHYFWAYAPATNVSNFSATPSTGVATFSYTSDFNHDLILSKTEKYWSYAETCANGEHSGDGVEFKFTHALAGIKVNYNILSQAQKNSAGTDIAPEPGRISITKVDLHDISTSGTGTFKSDGSYLWEPSSTTSSTTHSMSTEIIDGNYVKATSSAPNFVIPQTVPEKVLCLSVYDTRKKLTKPVFVNLPGHTNSKWDANVMHNYTINGTITASYQPEGVEGLKFTFDGHKFDDFQVIADLEGAYMATIQISWDGIPTGNGSSASQAYIAIVPESQTVIKQQSKPNEEGCDLPSKYAALGNGSDGSWPHIVFAADLAGESGIKSVARGSITETSPLINSHCTTGVISLPPDVIAAGGNFRIFAGYFGANGSGNPIWDAWNFNVEIVTYN